MGITKIISIKDNFTYNRRPKGWIKQARKKGGGTIYKDPSNPYNIIRQMPGNPKSPNVLLQNPYVKFMKDGKFYDVQQTLLKGKWSPHSDTNYLNPGNSMSIVTNPGTGKSVIIDNIT